MHIYSNEDVKVYFDEDVMSIYFQGSLRLSGANEYAPIIKLFDKALEKKPKQLIIDLRNLGFLNSSGINTISKIMIKMRSRPETKIVLLGSKQIAWQTKSLINLKRLLTTLTIEWH